MSNSTPSPALAGEVSKRSEDGGGAHAQAPAIHFSPPEHITVQILQDLSAPDCSFELIAQKAQTSVVALTLWMTRPDIAARIDALESAFARRSRLTIAGYTGFMLGALGRVIEQYNDTESHTLHREGDLKARALLTRNRENLVDAGKLLLRLKNAFPPPSPALAGEVAERSKAGGGTHISRSPTPAENLTTRSDPQKGTSAETPTDLHALRAARFPTPPPQPDTTPSETPGVTHKYPAGPKPAAPVSHPKSPAPGAPCPSPIHILPIALPVLQNHHASAPRAKSAGTVSRPP